jgi:uncharacterized protein YoxC
MPLLPGTVSGDLSYMSMPWLSLVLQICTLASIIISAIKILNRETQEWRDREERMKEAERGIRSLEAAVVALQQNGAQLLAMTTKIADLSAEVSRIRDVSTALSELPGTIGILTAEMGRLRDRLDRFLDRSSVAGGAGGAG